MRIRALVLVLAGLGVALLSAATAIALTPDPSSDPCACPLIPQQTGTGAQTAPIVFTPATSGGPDACVVSRPPDDGWIPVCSSPPPVRHTGRAVAVGIPGILLLAAAPALGRRRKRPERREAGSQAAPIEDAIPAWARRSVTRPVGRGLVHRFAAADVILDEDERRVG